MNLLPIYCVLGVVIQTFSFHIPDLKIDTEVGLDNNILNSHIYQNWSQSLNVGSASLVGLLTVLFITLLAFVRLQSQLSQHSRCLSRLQDDLVLLKNQTKRRQGRSHSSVL